MATLAAHDPGHGAHPWFWMKTRLFSWLQRVLHRRYSLRVWARALAWVQGKFQKGAEKHRNCTLA